MRELQGSDNADPSGPMAGLALGIKRQAHMPEIFYDAGIGCLNLACQYAI